MKINTKNFLITFIYVLTFISALTYMRFMLNNVNLWRIGYSISMVMIVALSFLYSILNMLSKRRSAMDSLGLLLVSMVLFEMLSSVVNGMIHGVSFVIDLIAWPAILLVFYDYSKEKELPYYFKSITIIGLSLVFVFCVPNILDHYRHSNGGAIFTTYYAMAFLPMIFYLCSRKTSVVFSAIAALLVLFSSKRAAFLIIIFGLMAYYFLLNMNEGTLKKRMRRMMLFFIVIIVVFVFGQYIIERFNLNILVRLAKMIDDGGSNRTKIWEVVLKAYRESDTARKWFGNGFHAVFFNVQPLGIKRFAHNSLVEALYDYGIVGLFLIVLFMLRIIKETINAIRDRNEYSPILAFCLIVMLILSFVSYFFEQAVIIVPICVIWGICFGKIKKGAYPTAIRGNMNI